MQHQKLMVAFSKNKDIFGWFGDFGIGKSLAALAYIQLRSFRKVLVISTKTSILSTWVDEVTTHSDFKYVLLVGTRQQKLYAMKMGILHGRTSSGPYHADKKPVVIFLLNFDGVKNIYTELEELNPDFVLLDESTKIKSPKSMRTKILWSFGKHVERKGIMTGFPITESLQDLYSQIKFLDDGESLGKSYYSFLDTYFRKAGFKYYPRKKRIPQLMEKIKPFCIRVTNDVIKLPPKMYKTIHVDPTAQQIKLFDELNSMFRVEFGKVKVSTDYIFALLNKSLQICDGFIQDSEKNVEPMQTNKDPYLLDILEEIDPFKNKVLIWTAFLFSTRKLHRLLSKQYPKVQILSGETKNEHEVIDRFQNDTKHNILIATQKKASASITLTNCRYAVYYSNTWSYDERSNSEARIRRKGSERHQSIIYTDLTTKGTVEQKVLDCLLKKKNLVDELKEEFS